MRDRPAMISTITLSTTDTAEAGTIRGGHFGYASTPSRAYMNSADGAPKIGTFVLGLDGNIAGMVNQRTVDLYKEAISK